MEYNGVEIEELAYCKYNKEELEEKLEHGCYTISKAPFYIMTGKGGAIEYILALKESLEQWQRTQ